MPDELLYLYGGHKLWDSDDWVTTDDRVRGGSSQSHLTVTNAETGCFHGNLDTSTLGGAGFASQHSAGILTLDLSSYDGIVIAVSGSTDGKRYALTLKDCIPGHRDDGRRKSGISWQAEFKPHGTGEVFLAWGDFKATYRGKDKPDAPPLDLANIKRIGLMMRSFFDKQYGDFSLEMAFIAARKKLPEGRSASARGKDGHSEFDVDLKAGSLSGREEPRQMPWWRSLFCGMLSVK